MNGPLSQTQRDVLNAMYLTDTGAVLFDGSYRFPADFRENPDLAERDMAKMLSDRRTRMANAISA